MDRAASSWRADSGTITSRNGIGAARLLVLFDGR